MFCDSLGGLTGCRILSVTTLIAMICYSRSGSFLSGLGRQMELSLEEASHPRTLSCSHTGMRGDRCEMSIRRVWQRLVATVFIGGWSFRHSCLSEQEQDQVFCLNYAVQVSTAKTLSSSGNGKNPSEIQVCQAALQIGMNKEIL